MFETTGTDHDDIDYISFYFDTRRYNVRSFFRSFDYLRTNGPGDFFRHQVGRYGFTAIARLLPQEMINLAFIGKKRPPIVFVDHHLSHLGSCYLASPFEDAAVLVVDSVGEYPSSSLYSAGPDRIKKVKSIYFPNSLGLIYTAVTEYLGLHPYGDEYKTMGLAAHGEKNDKFEAFFKELIQLMSNGGYRVDTRLINYHLIQNFTLKHHLSDTSIQTLGAPRGKGDQWTQRHKDIAFALQKRIEEAILHLLSHLQRKTKQKNLCMAGGVALNCVANGKIFEQTDFQNIFIQPAAGDAGASFGSALYYYNILRKQPRDYVMNHVCLGPEYSEEQIESAIKDTHMPYKVVDDPAKTAAELIKDGKIVAWFQGRMEFGPRALGNRSILCDPRENLIKEKLNRIKKRESYRPYAASVLYGSVGEYFKWSEQSPYMLVAVPVLSEARKKIPAVVHADGTCRIQTVDRERSPLFYRLLEEFKSLTGLPLLLNTSFNTGGEAIVCKPQDALKTFFITPLDALIIGNYLLEKT